jgi:ectoine hydroxylase
VRLTAAQLTDFHAQGFLILPALFSRAEVAVLRAEVPALFAEDTPANIREKVSGEVRTAMGLHLRSDVFARLCRHPRFVEPARQILGTDQLYIQQAKINARWRSPARPGSGTTTSRPTTRRTASPSRSR